MLPTKSIQSTIVIFFLLLLPITNSIDEKSIAKVICSLNPFKEVDVLRGINGDSVKLSKSLQKECNMKLRFVTSSVVEIGKKGIVSFASDEMNNKKANL